MFIEKIRWRAKRLGIRGAERMEKEKLICAIQKAEGKKPCFDQQWCRSNQHQMCEWKHDCQARIESFRTLILSGNVIIGYQVATLLTCLSSCKTQVVLSDREAYSIIRQGYVDAIIADIDTADLGGLAILIHAKCHLPSIMTYAITHRRSLYLNRIARDLGGCQGFFYMVEGKMELNTHAGLAAQLIRKIASSDSLELIQDRTTK